MINASSLLRDLSENRELVVSSKGSLSTGLSHPPFPEGSSANEIYFNFIQASPLCTHCLNFGGKGKGYRVDNK